MAEENGIGLEGLIPKRIAIYIFGFAGVLLITGAIILGIEGKLEPGLGFLGGVMFGVSSGLLYLRRRISKRKTAIPPTKKREMEDLYGMIPTLMQTVCWMAIGLFLLSFWTLTNSTFMLLYGSLVLGQGFGWFHSWTKLSGYKQKEAWRLKS
jgi:multisubunit Na+/H+ antiporter MnhB subunit